VPRNAPIEGQRPDLKPFGGDRHVIVINLDTNRLYEMFHAFPNSDGSWNAGSGAVFNLDSNPANLSTTYGFFADD
jgi:hypothetical protein